MQKETRDHYLEAMNRAMEFIEKHASQKIALKDIADYAFLSKFHFHRIFKSMIGDTAKDYLIRLRLEKAAVLLKNTSVNIAQIAYDCGYHSPETFNRAFKSFFSTTPLKFRESAKAVIAKKEAMYHEFSLSDLHVEKPRIIVKEDLNLAYIRHFGSYERIDRSFEQLLSWANHELVAKAPPALLGIVHDHLGLTEESNLRFDACITVDQEILPKGEIGYKKVKGGKFASFRYDGPFEEFHLVYDYIYHVCLFEYQWELRDEPALEWFVSPPPFYGTQQLITEFCLPIV